MTGCVTRATAKTAATVARALALLFAAGSPSLAQDLAISKLEHFTENRGWNEAGLGPTYQIVVTATVSPSGLPTLAYVEQGGERQPLTHFAQPASPDLYVYWRRFDAAFTGSWRIVAERGDARAVPATTPALARPQQLPFVRDVRVAGKGATPRLRWQLPDLAGFDIDRIRIAVRGGPRVQGRFLSALYTSGDLPPGATSFRIPAGVLTPGEHYVFQVMLDDLEGGRLENRSSSFSAPYTVSR
jgi:hypothetical protein